MKPTADIVLIEARDNPVRTRKQFARGPAEGLFFKSALVRHVNFAKHRGKYKIKSVKDFVRLVSHLGEWDREHAVAVLLQKDTVVGIYEVSIGARSMTLMPAESVLTAALLVGADSICLAHNHPQLDTRPSPQDRDMDYALRGSTRCFGIKLKYDVVIVKDGYEMFGAKGR